MADLVTADGDVVAEDLTRAELDRLQQEGVDVDTDAGGGGSGDGDADGDGSDAPDDTDAGGGGPDGRDDDLDTDVDDPTAGGHDPDADGTDDPDAPDDVDPDDLDDTQDGGDGDADPGADSAGDDQGTDPDGDAGDDAGDPADGADADGAPTDAPDPTSAAGDGNAGDAGGGAQSDQDAAGETAQDDAGSGADADGERGTNADADGSDNLHDGSEGPDMNLDGVDDLADDLDDLDDGWDDPDDGDGDDGDGDDGDGDDGDGPNATGSGGTPDMDAGGPNPDDLDDRVDDLLDGADSRNDTDADELATQAGDADQWEDRLDRAKQDGDDVREAKDHRRRRLDNKRVSPRKVDNERFYNWPTTEADEIRAWAQDSGIIGDIREQFESIKRAPRPRNVRRGTKIDRKRLLRFKRGDPNARDFYLKETGKSERAKRAVGVCLDCSGSMDPHGPEEHRIEPAKVALAGLAAACQEIGDDFTATGFRALQYEGDDGVRRNYADAPLITGIDEEFRWEHLDSVMAGGSTPMGYGVEKAARRLDRSAMKDKTLFVICDGEPTEPRYCHNAEPRTQGYESPRQVDGDQQTRRVIAEVRNAGIGVVGIGIGDIDEEAVYDLFKTKDGQDPDEAPYVMADAEDLPEKLKEAYVSQLDTV